MMINKQNFNIFDYIFLFISSGFYSGFVPKSPGTAGSLVCILVWYSLYSFFNISTSYFLITTLLIGTIATYFTLNKVRTNDSCINDPQFIVIDEWAGMLIALLPVLPSSIFGMLTAFALFRFFDITKLGPIGTAEKLPHALGIMADDILAGIASYLVMLAINNMI